MVTRYIDGELQDAPLPSPAIYIDGLLQSALLTVYTAAANTDQITPSVVIDGAYTGAPLLWTFGDGATSGDASATHTYTGTGPGGVWPVTLGPAEMLPFVTSLIMNGDRLTEALGQVIAKLPNLNIFNLSSNKLTGNIPAEIGNLTDLAFLSLQLNDLTGSIPVEISSLVNMFRMSIYDNKLTGNIPAEIGNLTGMDRFRAETNQLGFTEVGALNFELANQIFLHNNGMTEDEVDSAILDIFTNRANYTDATPAFNGGGDNAAPSGTYQDATPPTTGLEYIFKLANDPDAEGFNTWTVTWNGGSAP